MTDRLDDVIKDAKYPDDYADHDAHIYTLYGLIERLAREVKLREQKTVRVTGGTYTFRGKTYDWNQPPDGFREEIKDGHTVFVMIEENRYR